MNTILELFLVFFKIGACSFGGLSMIPVINEEMVGHGWMTLSEVSDIVAIAEMTPGPLGINAATFAGIQAAGILGAVAATLGAVTCGLTLCLAGSIFLARIKGNPYLERFTYGIRPVCIGIMLATAVSLRANYRGAGGAVSLSALAIGLAALWLLLKKNWSVPKVIAASAALGLLLGGL